MHIGLSITFLSRDPYHGHHRHQVKHDDPNIRQPKLSQLSHLRMAHQALFKKHRIRIVRDRISTIQHIRDVFYHVILTQILPLYCEPAIRLSIFNNYNPLSTKTCIWFQHKVVWQRLPGKFQQLRFRNNFAEHPRRTNPPRRQILLGPHLIIRKRNLCFLIQRLDVEQITGIDTEDSAIVPEL